MPLYSFKCFDCENVMEKSVSYEDRNAKEAAPMCDKCGKRTKYIFDFRGPCWIPPSV